MQSSLDISISGHSLKAIVDSASSDSFIDFEISRKLKLDINPVSHSITLAHTLHTAQVKGECFADITVGDVSYPRTKLDVIHNLCGDVIVGLDFQKQPSSLIIDFGGS